MDNKTTPDSTASDGATSDTVLKISYSTVNEDTLNRQAGNVAKLVLVRNLPLNQLQKVSINESKNDPRFKEVQIELKNGAKSTIYRIVGDIEFSFVKS